ncbi:MAG: hypothetical protein EPN47_13975 [Acidobacteria bacterium]|nr:MAG: hypothetical protein EPN47_13975 [Acidobacteriota bacterium]
MNHQNEGFKAPDEELANRITDAIGKTQIVSKDKLDSIREGLCRGNLSSADWKLLVELGSAKVGGPDHK